MSKMKKVSKFYLFIFLSIIFSLCFIFALKRVTTLSLGADVTGSYTGDKIHFIKNEENGSDSILIQTDGHCGLVDTMNPASNDSGYGLNTNIDNGQKVKNYVQKAGCTYLDFLIITHNHTDHHGGVGDIKDLINNKTIVFYKTDKVAGNDYNKDVEELKNWHNHDYYSYNMNIINSKNAITCDVSASNTNPSGKCYLPNIKNNYITSLFEDPNPFSGYDTNIDYTYYFDFGNYRINLYNLYTLSYNAENYNSIVTLVTHVNGIKTLLTGDIETSRGDIDFNNYNSGTITDDYIENPTGNCLECTTLGIENQLADVVGKIDILKAGHHGLSSSNSYYMLTKLEPSTYIIDNTYEIEGGYIYPKIDASAGILYMKKRFNTKSYYTNQSDSGLVVQFTSNNYTIKNYNCNSTCTVSTDIQDISNNIRSTNRWYRMNNITNGNKKYIYVYNKQVVTEWNEIEDNWYYFDSYGIMQEGLIFDGNNYYYLLTENDSGATGSMFHNGWKMIENRWYYFRKKTDDIKEGYKGSALTGWGEIKNTDNDVKNWYYFNTEGVMQEGLLKDNNDYYYLRHYNEKTENHPYGSMYSDGWLTIENNTYYFRTASNDVSTGKKGSAIKNECVTIDNSDYCFDKNGVLIEADISNLTIKDDIYVINNIGDTVKTITDLLGTTKNVIITRDEVVLSENDYLTTNDSLIINENEYEIVVLGDVKADGIIDIRDVAKAYSALSVAGDYSAYTYSEKYALDINNDGKRNGLDLIKIYDLKN